MQNEYALRAYRASAATRALKNGIRRQRPPDASEASGQSVSRKRRTVDLGETKAGSWGGVG
jgi:hypothetical protein